MSGMTKIAATIVAVFIGSFFVFSCLVYFQIKQNILDETTGALNQVREMVSLNLSAPELKTIVERSPHLSAYYFTGRLTNNYSFHPEQSETNDALPVLIPINENRYLIVTPHEDAELIQNLNLFYLVAGLFFTTFVLLLITLRFAVQQRLAPLNQLADALQKLSEGKATGIVNHSDITEMNQVINQFQKLQRALELKDQQLIKIDKQLAILQEQERSYLARELHDNVGQLLTTIKAHAYILSNAKEPSVVELSAHKVQQISHQISGAIRKLTAHLHPLVLDRVSLQASLERLVHEQELALPKTDWNISINLTHYEQEQERDIHIYRFVQEAINNVVKHAKASQVYVDIYGDQYRLSINIKDNGLGLGSHIVENIGMSSMRSRARCIGASCEVLSPKKGGVDVKLTLLLRARPNQLDAIVA
jgi:two-component system sensor histidine kinase UhpB